MSEGQWSLTHEYVVWSHVYLELELLESNRLDAHVNSSYHHYPIEINFLFHKKALPFWYFNKLRNFRNVSTLGILQRNSTFKNYPRYMTGWGNCKSISWRKLVPYTLTSNIENCCSRNYWILGLVIWLMASQTDGCWSFTTTDSPSNGTWSLTNLRHCQSLAPMANKQILQLWLKKWQRSQDIWINYVRKPAFFSLSARQFRNMKKQYSSPVANPLIPLQSPN